MGSVLCENTIPEGLLGVGKQIMITGSELTFDYRIQIYTPPSMLRGNPQPVITNVAAIVGYGQTFVLTFSSPDAAVVISRYGLSHLAKGHCMPYRQQFEAASRPQSRHLV